MLEIMHLFFRWWLHLTSSSITETFTFKCVWLVIFRNYQMPDCQFRMSNPSWSTCLIRKKDNQTGNLMFKKWVHKMENRILGGGTVCLSSVTSWSHSRNNNYLPFLTTGRVLWSVKVRKIKKECNNLAVGDSMNNCPLCPVIKMFHTIWSIY